MKSLILIALFVVTGGGPAHAQAQSFEQAQRQEWDLQQQMRLRDQGDLQEYKWRD